VRISKVETLRCRRGAALAIMLAMADTAPTLHVVSISGSPSADSRSTALLRFVERRLARNATHVQHLALRELPASELLLGRADAPPLRSAISALREADFVMVATPIYKAAYSGLLKVFLDLLPADTLRGKVVLPLATGGSPGHLLALEYALKPVLAALGARHVLDAVYVVDAAWHPHDAHGAVPAPEVVTRIDEALRGLGLRRPLVQPEPEAVPALC
jgi:FMN reductase